MTGHGLLGWDTTSQASRLGARARRGRRLWDLEGLEVRVLLSATVYTVTDTSGSASDTGSLPYAVNQANNNTNPAGSVIEFAPSVFNASTPGVIDLTSTLILESASGPEVIAGSGSNAVIIDGGSGVEPFRISNNGATAKTIAGVTIQNGSSIDGGGIMNAGNLTVMDATISGCHANGTINTYGIVGGQGGGIYNNDILAVQDCTFYDDTAGGGSQDYPSEGGGIYNAPFSTSLEVGSSTFNDGQATDGGGIANDNGGTAPLGAALVMIGGSVENCGGIDNQQGGGIYNNGTATISQVDLSGDGGGGAANSSGGAITNLGTASVNFDTIEDNSAEYGSGVCNDGTMTIDSTTISDNSAAGAAFGGGIYNDRSLTVTDSTISGNTISGGTGGGIADAQQGLDFGLQLTAINSTIANNEAAQGGGIESNGPATLVNCTIAYNTAQSAGAGLDVTAESNLPVLNNTIVALNTDVSGTADDIAGSVAPSSGSNLIGTGGSGGLTNTNGNQVDVASPGLVPLAPNGGPTETVGLEYGSPAVNNGSVALAVDPTNNDQPLATDQRGDPRTLVNKVDIGAVEHQSNAPFMLFGLDRGPAGLSMLQTASDHISLVPQGRKNDLPWIGLDTFQFDFNEPVLLTAADVTLQSARGINYGPITLSGSGTTYTIKFAQPIDKADRVTITVNIAGAQVFSGRLNVLPGDVNGDGVVNSEDLTAIRRDLKGKGSASTWIYGDLLDEGAVNKSDLAEVRKFLGTTLPRLAVKHPKATLARALVRRGLDLKRR